MSEEMPVNPTAPGICEFCGTPMTVQSSCLPGMGRVAYGAERRGLFAGEQCHDCFVVRGAIHHFGCDVEECPSCRGQMLGCDWVAPF